MNEVDIRKIKAGQKVEVGLDAYPDRKLKGIVTHVANVGEQRPNSDAKVFEVLVELDGTDPTLRPSMTTSNKILTSEVPDALFIPLECLHSDHDTITYVFRQKGTGTVKQEVIVGETNSNDAVVTVGLSESDRLFLSVPTGNEDVAVNLLPEMNGKRKKKNEEDEKAKPAVVSQKIVAIPSPTK